MKDILDAASELNKSIKYPMVLKSWKKKKLISEKGKSFQQAEGRHCTRNVW